MYGERETRLYYVTSSMKKIHTNGDHLVWIVFKPTNPLFLLNSLFFFSFFPFSLWLEFLFYHYHLVPLFSLGFNPLLLLFAPSLLLHTYFIISSCLISFLFPLIFLGIPRFAFCLQGLLSSVCVLHSPVIPQRRDRPPTTTHLINPFSFHLFCF